MRIHDAKIQTLTDRLVCRPMHSETSLRYRNSTVRARTSDLRR